MCRPRRLRPHGTVCPAPLATLFRTPTVISYITYHCILYIIITIIKLTNDWGLPDTPAEGHGTVCPAPLATLFTCSSSTPTVNNSNT